MVCRCQSLTEAYLDAFPDLALERDVRRTQLGALVPELCNLALLITFSAVSTILCIQMDVLLTDFWTADMICANMSSTPNDLAGS